MGLFGSIAGTNLSVTCGCVVVAEVVVEVVDAVEAVEAVLVAVAVDECCCTSSGCRCC